MSGARQRSRRELLMMMGSALASAFASITLRGRFTGRAHQHVPDSLLLVASRETCRHARRRVQVEPCAPEAVAAARDRLNAFSNQGARARYEHQTRQDFAAGRIAVIRGWVVAETELAVLSMIDR